MVKFLIHVPVSYLLRLLWAEVLNLICLFIGKTEQFFVSFAYEKISYSNRSFVERGPEH